MRRGGARLKAEEGDMTRLTIMHAGYGLLSAREVDNLRLRYYSSCYSSY